MKHTTYLFSHIFNYFFTDSPASYSLITNSPVTLSSCYSRPAFRLHAIPAFLSLFVAIGLYASQELPAESSLDKTATVLKSKVVTKAVNEKPIPLKEDEQIVVNNFADMVNSFFNIARDPRNPHNVALNVTSVLANIVNIALLATKNKSVRSKLNNGLDLALDNTAEGDKSLEIDLEKAQEAMRAYIAQLDPQVKYLIASIIAQRLIID